MKIRIYYEDTDAGGIVYHTNFIKYCERARSEMVFSKNLTPFTPNRHFVVSNINAKYLKPAFLGDMLEVKSKVLKLGKASVELLQSIFRGDELLFEATIKIAFLVDKKPAPLDSELVEFFKNYDN
ncbi:MAG: YbgC/FadM family acyl-CoA thioesterase [Campylobacteraceae bacterium]|nr:YbgC/FadM family acyl-CoA thioesterase [Campylobacteraceae bacterium]